MQHLKSGSIDFRIVAENISKIRQLEGLTQVKLAAKANVSVLSVLRAENGRPVRISTLKKIASGLNILYGALLISRSKAEGDIVVHRAANATWMAYNDSRTRLPDDYSLEYQDEGERMRLGRLGFVSSFGAGPTGIMEMGPGLVLIELYGELEGPYNSDLYKDAVIYLIRGRAKVEIGAHRVEISEGDWVGYRTLDLVRLAPAEDKASSRSSAVILWIGANRISKNAKRRA